MTTKCFAVLFNILHVYVLAPVVFMLLPNKKRKDGKPTGSSIFFYRFETFGNIREKDWYITLPDGERVLGTASGEGWAAAMTK